MFTDDHAFVAFPVMVPDNVSNINRLPDPASQMAEPTTSASQKNPLLPLRDQLQLDSWTVSGNSSTVKKSHLGLRRLSANPGIQAQRNSAIQLGVHCVAVAV